MNYLQSSRLRNAPDYEQIEKEEMLKHRRFQAAKRLSSKLADKEESKKFASPPK